MLYIRPTPPFNQRVTGNKLQKYDNAAIFSSREPRYLILPPTSLFAHNCRNYFVPLEGLVKAGVSGCPKWGSQLAGSILSRSPRVKLAVWADLWSSIWIDFTILAGHSCGAWSRQDCRFRKHHAAQALWAGAAAAWKDLVSSREQLARSIDPIRPRIYYCRSSISQRWGEGDIRQLVRERDGGTFWDSGSIKNVSRLDLNEGIPIGGIQCKRSAGTTQEDGEQFHPESWKLQGYVG